MTHWLSQILRRRATPYAAKRASARGFSLLELVVALGIAATVLLALLGTMRVAFTARASAAAAVQRGRQVTATAEAVRLDLEVALPPNGQIATIFLGTDRSLDGAGGDSLVFHTSSGLADIPLDTITSEASTNNLLVSPAPVAAEVQEIELTWAADPQDPLGGLLIRRIRKNVLAQVATSPMEQVIASGVRGINLRYFDGSAWLDAWDSGGQTEGLPKAVEIVLEFADGAAQQRLVQVVRLPMALTSTEGTQVIR